MILQRLYEYYQRKAADPDSEDMAPAGWELKPIDFLLVLNTAGKLVAIDDCRLAAKPKRAMRFLLPQVNRTSGVAAGILWDKPAYIWGYDPDGHPERLERQRLAFRDAVTKLPQDDPGIAAALAYLSDPKSALAQAQAHQREWAVIEETAPFLAFQLARDTEDGGKPKPICRRPAVAAAIDGAQPTDQSPTGICLVTGRRAAIPLVHSPIKGVPNAQTSGAALVSFNRPSFRSYGKSQGENAPIGAAAADGYVKALNHLLGKTSRQKIHCGTTTIVFWAQSPSPDADALEQQTGDWLASQAEPDDPDRRTESIKALLSGPRKGARADLSGQDKFYVLGLSPNAARLSVRFWLPTTVASLQDTLRDWFDQIELTGGRRPYPPLRSLLSSLALQFKLDNLPPLLEGKVVESIFRGTPFPATLLPTALARMRAERHLPHLRAALIKAVLVRNFGKDLTMTLDPENPDRAYQLGRLFAAFEKTQEDIGTGDTVKGYFGAASMRPATIFRLLFKLHRHHLARLGKLRKGQAVNREKLILEITGRLDPRFPTALPLDQQGIFAVGYYHQRQAFFTKADKEGGAEPEPAAA